MRAREFAVPVQAFLAVTICFSLVWMIYAMAFFDPTPPTAAEIESLVTEDPEINGLKTAAALTINAMFFGPTLIQLPSSTPIFTATFLPTYTATYTITASSTATPTVPLIVVVTRTHNSSDPLPPTKIPTATATLVPSPTPTDVPPTTVPSETPTEPPTATELPTEPPTATEPPTEPPTATEPPALNTTSSP